MVRGVAKQISKGNTNFQTAYDGLGDGFGMEKQNLGYDTPLHSI